MPILIDALRGKNPTTLASAATALAELGPKAHAAIPALLAALKESFASKEGWALESSTGILTALGRVAPQSPETGASSEMVIAKLSEALDVPSARVQAAAAEALGNFGPRASKMIPKLVELELQHEKAARASEAAADALKKIIPETKLSGDSKDAQAVPKESK